MPVEIKFDESKLRRIERILKRFPGALRKVVPRAINKTAKSARTLIVRLITKQVATKKKTTRDRLKIYRATGGRWAATIGVSLKRIPLIAFGARPMGKAGVSYKIGAASGRQKATGAFIQTMSTGHKGVFKRIAGSRLPIVEKFGPSPGFVFEGTEGLAKQVMSESGKTLEKILDQQAKLILNRKT